MTRAAGASVSARSNRSLSFTDCCHCLMLRYRLHHRKKTKENCTEFAATLDQSILFGPARASRVAKAAHAPHTKDQAAALQANAGQEGARRSSERQTGRNA